jgi:hypothetical protein
MKAIASDEDLRTKMCEENMRRFAAIKTLCPPALLIAFQAVGQTTFSGRATDPGQSIFASGNGPAAPNFCAYNGVDVIPWSSAPALGGAINNGATVYDTSYFGHLTGDGVTTFSNAALLSEVTRLTDSVSAAEKTNVNFAVGMGGSGVFTLPNTNTTLGRADQSSIGMICVFATSGVNGGYCGTRPGGWAGTPPVSGIFITAGQLVGGSCSTNCPVHDFGSISFSLTMT